MIDLFGILFDVFKYFFGWLAGFLNPLFAWLVSTMLLGFYFVVNAIQFCLSYVLAGLIFIVDLFLQSFVAMCANLFHGDIFGLVSLSKSLISSYITTILTVAPNVKLVGYIINYDALSNVFSMFAVFLAFWCVYRWFRVWVRG